MAEPRTSLHRKGSIIISVVLVRLYTISGEKGSDQLSKKDHTTYKKAVEKSQPKSIGDGRGGDDAG
jgi:hypothetical protein